MPRLLPVVVLITLAAGCGGSSVPDGDPFAVRLDVLPGFYGNAQGIRAPQPMMVSTMGYAEWRTVSRLLPEPLPEPLEQRGCESGYLVSVQLVSHNGFREVQYGPCRRPASIEPVRLFLHTLLRRRLAAERRCDCP